MAKEKIPMNHKQRARENIDVKKKPHVSRADRIVFPLIEHIVGFMLAWPVHGSNGFSFLCSVATVNGFFLLFFVFSMLFSPTLRFSLFVFHAMSHRRENWKTNPQPVGAMEWISR
jgi:hypothetical protein